MSKPRPRTARELLDSVDAPSVGDPLVLLFVHAALSVGCVVGFGVAVAHIAPFLDSPGLFVAVWCLGLPLSFALPGLALRRLGGALVRRR